MIKKESFNDLIRVMARLRGPQGCPWDREQTHESLLRYLREESKEVEDAVRKKDWHNLQEELGDILLQVIFHARMAEERGAFDIHDVVDHLAKKLTGRHPHVFGAARGEKWTSADVKARWSELKAREKGWKEKDAAKMRRKMKGKELL